MSTDFLKNVSFRHNVGKEPLQYLTLGQLAEISALRYGDIPAVESVEQNSKLTYSELLDEGDKFAAGLIKLGMEKGDRLGLWTPNCMEWFVVNTACTRAGFILVMLNPANGTLEMEYSIKMAQIKFIVCPYEGKHRKFCEILTQIVPELTKTGNVSVLNSKTTLKGIIVISDLDYKMHNAYNYQKVLQMASADEVSKIKNMQNKMDPDDPCYIIFSSGTTSKPKAVLLSHFQVLNSSHKIAKRSELDRKQHRICAMLPLFHVGGTTMTVITAVHAGATLVLPSQYYTPRKNLLAIAKNRCTFIMGTPTMYIDLIDVQKNYPENINNIEAALIGGAPVSPDLCDKIKEILHVKCVKVLYGLTEGSGPLFHSMPGEKEVNDTVGYIIDHIQIKIIDQDGNIQPIGQPGEICVRGYCVMLGYWGDEENTKKVIQPDGWLKTGDIGILQSDGYARIVGRKTDIIIRGGENIYPREVEELINTHPGIAEVQVLGIPHQRLGEELCACVRMEKDASITKTELFDFCKEKIARHKFPTLLTIVENFPKTSSGKVQRSLLREQICNGLFKAME